MTPSLRMISFTGELRALCEKHEVALQADPAAATIWACFYAEDNTEVTDPLADVTLVEDRL